MKICKLDDQNIAVTDEMGTIRIFAYPCESSAGLAYSSCYC
jgi:hypothetical protein